jgi:ParB family chromosome partitioning protein
MSVEKQRRLGRGLEALIGPAQNSTSATSDLQRIPIGRIRSNPFQPRREFEPTALAELEASIRSAGLLQPISVRRAGDGFELIAGERRLRAVTNLQWKDVPAVVRELDDQTMLVLALVENLQRADLNPLEEARGYQRLLGEFSLTHQEVADAVGKDRSTVTNLLRVLTLPEPVQQLVESRALSAGHARAIAGLPDSAALSLAHEAVTKGLSVRQLEERARGTRTSAKPQVDGESKVGRSSRSQAAAREIEDRLRHYLQTDVQVELTGDSKGIVRIAFYSADDLERVMELIAPERASEHE